MPSPAPPSTLWRWTANAWALLAVAMTLFMLHCFQEDQTNSGTWGCEMSYMWPTYHQVDWPDNPSQKYSLWLYREQGWDRDLRPTGHPVIFVPGNAGSFKQVRSIASSAARQYYTESGRRAAGMEDKRNLDFFAVDYNEDFSAFHAATLRDQATFLVHSARHVLEQYDHLPEAARPKQLTLLGHSMGGIAARLAWEDLQGLVDVILTMSTPHALPPVTLERGMDVIWNTLGRQVYDESAPLLISICGGTADTQIASDACVIPEAAVQDQGGFTVFTTGMPGTWTSVEHQAMVWCHQVRWRVARVLLDMTARTERQDKLAVAEQWLLGTTSSANATTPGSRRIPVTSRAMSIRVDSSAYDLGSPVYWCETDGDCQVIRAEMTVLPAPSNLEAPFPLPGEGMKPDEQEVIVDFKVPKASGWLALDLASTSQVSVGHNVTMRVHGNSWKAEPRPQDTHLTLQFPDVSASSLLVHRLEVDTVNCQGQRPTIRYGTMYPGPNTHEHRFFPNAPSAIYVHSHIGWAPFLESPFISFAAKHHGSVVDVYQNPECQVSEVKLSIAIRASLAKLVTRYRMVAVVWIIGWMAHTLNWSLGIWQSTGMFVPLVWSLDDIGRRPFLTTAATVFSLCLSPGGLGLDATGAGLFIAFAFLAPWTHAIVHLISRLLDAALWLSSLVMKSKRGSGAVAPMSLTSVAASSLPLLLAVQLFIPHQMAFLILLAILAAATVTEHHDGRFNFMATIVMFMITLLPFNAPVLAVWGRNIWADFRHPFPGDYDALRILPLLSMIALCVSGRSPRPKKTLVQATKFTVLLLSVLAFAIGPRYPYIIPYIADIFYIEMACLML